MAISLRHDEVRGVNVTSAMERATVSWSAIFAGVIIALLSYCLLVGLGLGTGGSALRRMIQSGRGGEGLGLGTGFWMVVSIILSLFAGSYLSGKIAGLIPSRIGRIQGLVISGLFFGVLFSQAGALISTLGQGFNSAVSASAPSTLDLARDSRVQNAIEQSLGDLRFRSPPGEVIQGLALRLVQNDSIGARDYLAREAGISPANAERRLSTLKKNLETILQQVGGDAAKAVSMAGWTLFFFLGLGTLASVLGGGWGAQGHRKEVLLQTAMEKPGRPKVA